MDSNNTYFHLVWGRRDWLHFFPDSQDEARFDVIYNHEKEALTLRPLVFRFRSPGIGGPLTPADRRGSARDRYGNWYFISRDRRAIRFLPKSATEAESFWPGEGVCAESQDGVREGSFAPLEGNSVKEASPLQALAVTENHYLTVGSPGTPGILVFDLHAGGPPLDLRWPVDPDFQPFDMSPRSGGGIWILDGSPLTEPYRGARLWCLDRHFRLTGVPVSGEEHFESAESVFKPLEGDPRPKRIPLQPIALDVSPEVSAGDTRVMALECLPDDSVLLLDVTAADEKTYLRRFWQDQQQGETVSLNDLIAAGLDNAGESDDLKWAGHDMAFLPGDTPQHLQARGSLMVVGSDGNQAYEFLLEADREVLELQLIRRFYPLRRYSGKALVSAGGSVHYDVEDEWFSLVEQPKPRFEVRGELENPADITFDGKKPDCIWHRFLMDACVPSGCEVRVQVRAANDRNLLERISWRDQPVPYRRKSGAEVPFYRPFGPTDPRHEHRGTYEFLFQEVSGRYLQIRLLLKGTGRASPRIHSVRLYYPRFSYLHEYLPAVYGADETSASFLDRFLANVEGFFTDIEGKIAAAEMLFDDRTTYTEFVDWLGGWLGMILDGSLSEEKKRLFIRHAIRLFRERGTHEGLIRLVRLALDPCVDEALFTDRIEWRTSGFVGDRSVSRISRNEVRIIEQFRTRSMSAVMLGDPSQADQPRLVSEQEPWAPSQGAERLHQLFRLFADEQSGDDLPQETIDSLQFSPVPPSDPDIREVWDAFVATELNFTYEIAGADEVESYRSFLRRRYRQIAVLNQAWQRDYSGFGDISLPEEGDFPSGGTRLNDWIQFVSFVLPVNRNAHRFTLLVSTDPGADVTAQEKRLAIAARIVHREKPAHTSFDVRPFWAMFSVGSARVGFDTIVEEGSRYLALLIGEGRLSEGYLGYSHPWYVPDRIVTGRDGPGSSKL